jgi:hypothetical protein
VIAASAKRSPENAAEPSLEQVQQLAANVVARQTVEQLATRSEADES